ncbi:hypothetical protein OPV22_032188 [Ensete ventricosum]|uniref:Clp R domain-containing protein n=1 Tax=Ensete ventricosum TaxID=4639 RepID=A0AAV8PUQ6_ENSVE|nr:hypothetical protein OPV22_032188 [Ensete ventricosum]
MRTGACTLQQALTAEAASVLKHSLGLARRRGHAQVTPLHVAATLLSSSSSATSSLLRRACLRSQPHHPASHPLRCKALELCLNVALNRLPTAPPPPSSGPLLTSQPSLSNALIAALKRAQAHQRRGCVELQQQQQQSLLAIKVELEQLIISILDDPSVSRVMREAGFSSTCVKNNLEEESSVLGQSTPFLLEPHKDIIGHGSSFWKSPLYKLSSRQSPPAPSQSSQKEDLSAVMEVMLRKQGRRTNTVVVGDSVAMTEGVVTELMAKVERGDVPDELKSVDIIKLHLSYGHLRLMRKSDVDLKVSDLRKKISSMASDGVGGNVIIYAGDLRWAVDEEAKDGCGFRPVEHMVAELGRLLCEFRSSINHVEGTVNNKVWLLATASYNTYLRCQMRQPSLEKLWTLQAVVVPSGRLALSLQAPSGPDSKVREYPLQLLGSEVASSKDGEKLICCDECTSHFEKEALVLESEAKDTNFGSIQLPSWLQRQRPDKHHQSEIKVICKGNALLELKRKWNGLCQSLHHTRQHQSHLYPPFFSQSSTGKNNTCSSSYPWWSSSNQSKIMMQPYSLSFCENTAKLDGGSPFNSVDLRNGMRSWQQKDEPKPRPSEVCLNSLRKPGNQDVGITLSLWSGAVSDSATSNEQEEAMAGRRELTRKLQDNMPRQSEIIPAIVEALSGCRTCENKALRVLLRGSDGISKRRLARAVLEHFGGSTHKLIHVNMRKVASETSSCGEILGGAFEKDSKFVVFIEDIDQAGTGFLKSLANVLKAGAFENSSGEEVCLADSIFVMTTSHSADCEDINEGSNSVIKMMLRGEGRSTEGDLKRKPETESQNESKRPRTRDRGLDLNLLAEEEEDRGWCCGDSKEDEQVPSDLTSETDGGMPPHIPPQLLDLMTAQFTLERPSLASENLASRLHQAFDEARSGEEGTGQLSIDGAAVEELMAAAGSLSESFFERWVREVFQASLRTVEKGGNVRLSVEGKEGNVVEFGFMGSVLPGTIAVE